MLQFLAAAAIVVVVISTGWGVSSSSNSSFFSLFRFFSTRMSTFNSLDWMNTNKKIDEHPNMLHISINPLIDFIFTFYTVTVLQLLV